MAKQLNTRIRHKFDTRANWTTNKSKVPLAGELIIYSDGAQDGDVTPAIKIGDGSTTVENLKFVSGTNAAVNYQPYTITLNINHTISGDVSTIPESKRTYLKQTSSVPGVFTYPKQTFDLSERLSPGESKTYTFGSSQRGLINWTEGESEEGYWLYKWEYTPTIISRDLEWIKVTPYVTTGSSYLYANIEVQKDILYNASDSYLTNVGATGSTVKKSGVGTITQSGNTYTINITVDTNITSEYVSTPSDNPCLIEGTKITMADGSEKSIEEVKNGDLVLSWDPNTQEQVTSMVIYAVKTGISSTFDVYGFSNGSCLTAYGMHGIYDAHAGVPIDIRTVTRSCYFLTQDGEKIKWVDTIKRAYHGLPKSRYTLYTTNNLYYANNILLGNSAYFKLDRLVSRKLTKFIPENILEVWQQDADAYNNLNAFVNDNNFLEKAKDLKKHVALANSLIRINKDKLSATDYKVQKFSEGFLTNEEFEVSKVERNKFRKLINEQEEILNKSNSQYRELIREYRKGKSKKSVFEECCKRDNELFETIQNYVKENGNMIPTFVLRGNDVHFVK